MCDEDTEDCHVLVDACTCKHLAVLVYQGPHTHLHEPGHAADRGWQLEGQGGPHSGTSTHSDVAEGEDGLEESHWTLNNMSWIMSRLQGGMGMCYAPMGHIVRCAGSRHEVVSGLQFGVSQVLTEQGSKSM